MTKSVRTSKKKYQSRSWFSRLVHNQMFWVSLGFVVLQIILATCVYPRIGNKSTELVYAVNPIRTQIVTAGKASGLDVLFDEEKLGDVDITAVQVAIWNSGGLSIRTENVLKDVIIRLEPQTKILEASIIKYNRDYGVTEVKLETSSENLAKGIIPVTWRILENNDGATIQIIYLGSANVSLFVDGLIEGAGTVNKVESGITIKTPEEQISEKSSGRGVFIVMICITSIIVFAGIFYIFSIRKDKEKLNSRIGVLFGGILVFLVQIGIYGYFLADTYHTIGPPFGF